MRIVHLLLAAACAAFGMCLAVPVDGQVRAAEGVGASVAPAPAGAPGPKASADRMVCRLPAGTLVPLEILEPLDSSVRARGDRFALQVSAPVLAAGRVVIPAGTPGVGEVVHAAHSHGGGQAGELVLAARYLDLDGAQLALRGMKVGQATTGRDTSNIAIGLAPALGPFALFVHGGEIRIPPHTPAQAKLARDVVPTRCPAAAGPPSDVPVAGGPGATTLAVPSTQPKE